MTQVAAALTLTLGVVIVFCWLSCGSSESSSESSTATLGGGTAGEDLPPASVELKTLDPADMRRLCSATLGSSEFAVTSCTTSALLIASAETTEESAFRDVCRQRRDECLGQIDFQNICSSIMDMADSTCTATVGEYQACTQLQTDYISTLRGCDGAYEEIAQYESPIFQACEALTPCYSSPASP